jgi:glycosyltransferase involved in cell wall biosynthesis
MRILMLDKNFLVDRRITLMAESLARDGHEIHLVHTETPAGFADVSESRRRLPRPKSVLKCLAVSAGYNDYVLHPDGVGSPPPHVLEVRRRGYIDPRLRVEYAALQRQVLRSRYRSKLFVELLNYLRYPDVAVGNLRQMTSLGAFRHMAAAPFAILAVPQYIRNAIYSSPDVPNMKLRGVRELDLWETNAVRYAYKYWRPDIVVANDAVTLRAAVEIKALLGIPLVYDAHELYSYQPGIPHQKAKELFREERQLLSYVDELVVINKQQGQIMERDLDVKSWTACSNATPWPPRFDINKRYDWIRDEAAIPLNHKIILFQGGINVQRRIDLLLKGLAAVRRKDIHLVFLTFGSEIPQFKAMAEDLGIGDRVHFLDIVPWDEVLFWAASADAGIMPYQATDQNTTISSPNKMYEFIMAGTPMIGSSELINVRRVVETENFGVLVPFRSSQDYTAAIEEMFDRSRGGAERFRPALIERAHVYSWDNESTNVMVMYRRLIEKFTQEKLLQDNKLGKSSTCDVAAQPQ